MKYIEKQSPPEAFVKYQQTKGASFKDLSDGNLEIKRHLRLSLLEEQGFICCYCGQELKEDASVIEHLKSKDYHPQLQFHIIIYCAHAEGGKISGQTIRSIHYIVMRTKEI